jgi:hypothetical protein
VRVRARHDSSRERLAELLGYSKPLGTRLDEALFGNSDLIGESWRLIEDADDPDWVGEQTEWQFVRSELRDSIHSPYRFVVSTRSTVCWA